MLGLLIIIVISWLLLHFFEQKSIDALGIMPSVNRAFQFFVGFIIISLIALINIYVETRILNIDWELKTVSYRTIFNALWYHLKSALTEDLIFRGAILYILIRRIGAKWAIFISALFFGVYHVFSYGMMNERLIPILYVILVTGFTGYVWAYSFYKTKSIMMGFGFHLGINITNSFFFESQPYGELIFEAISKVELRDWDWLYFSPFKGLFPSVITLASILYLMQLKFFKLKDIV
ncbi:CPBP family intramembrane glutamic endopeptidase [Winogradskyella algicola]|uniref:CPBP family intramembrane glutamic endopeptidase n=1 Tax=Winogradskyella algicola TaxID=2575815 RepID=UPI001108434D|nr:CPBP family intramembrane glutamic endopeptidase [Winogradskyella algicola]